MLNSQIIPEDIKDDRKFSENLFHNISELWKVLTQGWFVTSKHASKVAKRVKGIVNSFHQKNGEKKLFFFVITIYQA